MKRLFSFTSHLCALRLCAASLVTLAGGAAFAQGAQPPKAVVELFTSQGCSSCPPADKLFVELARDPSMIALTLPVDYWDYLGWKDTLANPAFSSRQRHYAQLRGDSNVYTPQAVVNGVGHVLGSDKSKIGQHVASAALPVAVTLAETDDGLAVTIAEHDIGRMLAAKGGRGALFLMPVTARADVPVARGENRGKTIAYANVVRDIHPLGEWTGEAKTISLPRAKLGALAGMAGSDGFVVILQAESRKGAKILGAARSKGLLPPAS